MDISLDDSVRQAGAAALEYALLVALIAGVALVAVARVGGDVRAPYEAACRAMPGNGNGNAGSPPGNGVGLAHAPGQNRGFRC